MNWVWVQNQEVDRRYAQRKALIISAILRMRTFDRAIYNLTPSVLGYRKALQDDFVTIKTPTVLLLTESASTAVHYKSRGQLLEPSTPETLKSSGMFLMSVRVVVVYNTFVEPLCNTLSIHVSAKRPVWLGGRIVKL